MKKVILSALFLFFIGPSVFAQATEKKSSEVKTASASNEFELLKGNYTSKENPDGILFYVQGDKLVGKIPGKPSMILEPVTKYTFKTEGIFIAFEPENKKVILRQKSGVSIYSKQ